MILDDPILCLFYAALLALAAEVACGLAELVFVLVRRARRAKNDATERKNP